MEYNKIKSFFKRALIFWIVLILGSLTLVIVTEYDHAKQLIVQEAQTSIKKDLMFRKWVASHGGVYVPITETTPPNPYLKNIQERDIETPMGTKLTLMNPAYTLSHMMREYSDLYGIKGHTTSLNLLNPNNKADKWEEKQLHIIGKNKKAVYEITYIDDKKYLRYINPIITTKECLKCHVQQGYKVGDASGAVSVSIPVLKYYDEALEKSLLYLVLHIIILAIGLVALKIAYSQSRRWINENNEYKNELKDINANLEKKVKDGINELRSKDDILMKQSKNAAMGEMIGNIAHQWRQPLNSLGLTVQDIREEYLHGKIDQKYVEETISTSMKFINNMSKTIDDFGNFFKPDKEATEFYILDILDEVKEMAGASLKNSEILLEVINEENIKAYGYKNEFSHVLLNIISNAKDAFENSDNKNKRVVITVEEDKNNCIIKISDNAGGIPKGLKDKIFEPYFTTKFKTNGTGIGLYMSKTIIEKNMYGQLSVRNIDNGAEFTISVPLSGNKI